MSWRETARAVVAECVREVGLQDRPALRRKLRDAYPFGERRTEQTGNAGPAGFVRLAGCTHVPCSSGNPPISD